MSINCIKNLKWRYLYIKKNIKMIKFIKHKGYMSVKYERSAKY